eukprot:745809-Hanusia_phi.AAC.1
MVYLSGSQVRSLLVSEEEEDAEGAYKRSDEILVRRLWRKKRKWRGRSSFLRASALNQAILSKFKDGRGGICEGEEGGESKEEDGAWGEEGAGDLLRREWQGGTGAGA